MQASRATERGHRGVLLPVPPNWPEDGLAKVACKKDTGDVHVQHRFTEELATVPAKLVPAHSSVKDLYVEFNWSEERLALASHAPGASQKPQPLKTYFVQPERKTEEVEAAADGQRVVLRNLCERVVVTPVKKKSLAQAVGTGGSPGTPDASSQQQGGDAAAGAESIAAKQEVDDEITPAKSEVEKLCMDESTMAAPMRSSSLCKSVAAPASKGC